MGEVDPFKTGANQPSAWIRVGAVGLGLASVVGTVAALESRGESESTPIIALWHGGGDITTFCDDTAEVKVIYPQEDWSAFTSLASPGFGSETAILNPGGSKTFGAHVGDVVNPTEDFDTDNDGDFHDAGGSEHWQMFKNGIKLVHPKDCPAPTTTTIKTPESTTTTTIEDDEESTTTTIVVTSSSTTLPPIVVTTTVPAATTTTEAPKPSTTIPAAHTD